MLYWRHSIDEHARKGEGNMAQKWGSNENIHIGDIFHVSDLYDDWRLYYQVTALRGRTQVILHAIQEETYFQEGISEDSPLYWHRKRVRPLLGQFLPMDKPFVTYGLWERGQYMEFTQELVTAWVLPDLQIDGRTRLRAVGLPWRKFWGFFQRTGNPGMRKQLDGWRKKIVRNKKCYTDVY